VMSGVVAGGADVSSGPTVGMVVVIPRTVVWTNRFVVSDAEAVSARDRRIVSDREAASVAMALSEAVVPTPGMNTVPTALSDAWAESAAALTARVARAAESPAGAESTAVRLIISIRTIESVALALSEAPRTASRPVVALSEATAASKADRASTCAPLPAASPAGAESAAVRTVTCAERLAASEADAESPAARAADPKRIAVSAALAESAPMRVND
jgi:hypothetical protein